MESDMLLLAERLVIAMEGMAQDVKYMSSYVYDLSCSVSYLLNEKREKECTSVVNHDESDNSASVTSAAEHEASAEREFFGQYEQAAIADLEQWDFGYIASTSTDTRENVYAQSSESNPVFTDGIKVEELSQADVSDELCDVHNMDGKRRHISTFCKEESVTEGQTEAFAMCTTIRNPPELLTPSDSLERAELQATHVLGEMQHAQNSGDSAVNCNFAIHPSRIPEGQDITHQVPSAMDTSSVVLTRADSEEKLHKCSMCGKSFEFPSALQRHIRVHTGERPYTCTVCGKAFSEKAKLGIHMRSHTGERPYKCSVCGDAFSKSHNLTIHMRIHTGEKPYRCAACGREFRHRHVLNRHMNTHSAEHTFQ